MKRLSRMFFVSMLVGLFALSACTTNNSNSELLSETIGDLVIMSAEAMEYAEEKATLLNQEEVSEADMEKINTATFELETRRIRIDTQVAALKDGNVSDGREKVSVEKDLEDHQDLVSSIVDQWNNIADDLLAISDTSEFGEHVEEALAAITSSDNQFNDKLVELQSAISE